MRVRAVCLAILGCVAALLFAADNHSHTAWTDYLGGPDSSQYSALKQINKSNVNQLQVAWTYPTGDKNNYTFNPVIVDGVMYVLAKNNSIVALDAATGREIWSHPNNTRSITARGVNYWESKDRSDRRLLYCVDNNLVAIDARTGQFIPSFGENGRLDLRVGFDRDPKTLTRVQNNTPGRVFENLVILGSASSGDYESNPGVIRAFSVTTGKLAWVFHTIPQPGEFGYDTWPKDAWKTVGGVQNWSEMTLDDQRGVVYIPLASPSYDFYGANRKGQNLFGNCLLALDARSGKRLWHFQFVHHDLWDYDTPAAPKLLTVRHDGKMVEAVAQPTKQGFLFVFDRVTGQPLWPIEERAVPKSDVPGEEAWPTQPFPTKPPPFSRQKFNAEELNPFIPEAERAPLRDKILSSRNEGLYTPPSLRGSIEMPGHNGGGNWGGSAVDPSAGLLYVQSKDLPTLLKLDPRPPRRGPAAPEPAPSPADTAGPPRYWSPVDFLLASNRLSAIGPPWSQLTAYDLNTGAIKWQIPLGEVSALAADGHTDTGSHWPRGGLTATGGGLLLSATTSDRKFRAYDRDSGKVIWETSIAEASESVPAVYEVGGREYIVLCVAAGNGMMGGPLAEKAGSYVAYALPAK